MYAMEVIRAGLAVHGQVFTADWQTEGRGQRGRSWHSEPGKNLQMSVLLQCSKLATSQRFALSVAVSLALLDAIYQTTQMQFAVKWPNDIYYNDRKAGGILIENAMQGNTWQWAVVGMGLNVNQTRFEAHLPNATSLQLVAGKQYPLKELVDTLCFCLERRWRQLHQGGAARQITLYNQHLYAQGQQRRLRTSNAVTNHHIYGVNAHGQLQCGLHGEYLFDYGEVEWV